MDSLKMIDNEIKNEVTNIFGKDNIIDSASVLSENGNPDLIVQAEDKSQIIDLVKLAIKNNLPIIPKSSKIDYYDGAIPVNGGVLLDMTNMKKILNIRATSSRNVTIQPGVTYEELQKNLNEKGYKCMVPLGLPSQASVLSSYLERIPLLSAPMVILFEGSQCIMDLEVIRGDGTILHTGSAATVPTRPGISPNGPIGPDWTRVFTAAQGTMGIVTEMTLKFKHIPNHQKILLKLYENLEKMLNDMVKIKRMDIGKECLGISSLNLATILATDKEQILALSTRLPKWTLVLNITGFDNREVEILEEDLKDLNIEFSNDELKDIIEVSNLEKILLEEFNLPNKLVAHRTYKENCQILPFYARKSRILEHDNIIQMKADKSGYKITELNGYVMPVEQARVFYIEYTFHSDASDLDKVNKLFEELSDYIISSGGIIDRPYGIWREMIYSRIPGYMKILKDVKNILDPHNIFNPGKIIPLEGD
jgi:glycolate oxidase